MARCFIARKPAKLVLDGVGGNVALRADNSVLWPIPFVSNALALIPGFRKRKLPPPAGIGLL